MGYLSTVWISSVCNLLICEKLVRKFMVNKLHSLEIAATFDIYQVRDKRLVVRTKHKNPSLARQADFGKPGRHVLRNIV